MLLLSTLWSFVSKDILKYGCAAIIQIRNASLLVLNVYRAPDGDI